MVSPRVEHDECASVYSHDTLTLTVLIQGKSPKPQSVEYGIGLGFALFAMQGTAHSLQNIEESVLTLILIGGFFIGEVLFQITLSAYELAIR